MSKTDQTPIEAAAAAAAANDKKGEAKPEKTSKAKPEKISKAIVTKAFKGAPDGQLHPKSFDEGDDIEGDLAAAMVAAGYAKKA